MSVSREILLDEFLIPGTSPEISNMYHQIIESVDELQFELIEDDVIILDTETTGLSPQSCSLIEIAALRMSGREIIDEFHTYVDPGCEIPLEICELTGITNKDVDGAPSPPEAVSMFAEFAGELDLVAHNASFDRDFIMRQATPGALPGSWIDTLSLSQIALPRLKSHRLIDLARTFGLPLPSHQATDDTTCLAALWRILLASLQLMMPGLAARIANLSPQSPWPLRTLFSRAAQQHPGTDFSIRQSRVEYVHASAFPPRPDADDIPLHFCSDAQIDEAFSATGVVGSMYSDYETRDEQLAMAHAVFSCLREGGMGVIEAGTGVGKSMAYLVPAAFVARENKITAGVATKTNALMDQLVYHELPRLKQAMGDLSFVALKGYEHYLCLRKLDAMTRASTDDTVEIINMLATLMSFTAQTGQGDLDALNISWARLPRFEIQANSHDCLKKRCPYFPQYCYLHGARRQATSADIVVTNHALLFRDMQVDNGILPPIRHWIVDEAHSVEAEARRQLSCVVSSRDLESTLARVNGPKIGILSRVTRRADRIEGGGVLYGISTDIENRIGHIQLVSAGFFDQVSRLAPGDARTKAGYSISTVWISEQVRDTEAWRELLPVGYELVDALRGLNGRLSDLMSMLEQFEDEFPGQVAELTSISSDVRRAVEALELVLNGSDGDFVYSIEVDKNIRRPLQTLEAMRVDIGASLADDLYPQARSIIFTSATLSTAERDPFAHFMRASGLDRVEDKAVRTFSFESSYDYDKNMTILLPSDLPDPTSSGYREAFAELLYRVHVAMGGSVLTLFTNRREMESLYRELKPRLAESGVDLIAQTRGTSTKALRDRFLSDRNLSLFALKSFWEGFDAPGETLRCVIIARLPFGRPDDPLACERQVRDGRGAWAKYTLPEAIVDLKQAAGRLIRNSTDSGWLILADTRLQTKGYGKSFLRAMPTSDIRTLGMDEIARLVESQDPDAGRGLGD